MPEPKPAAVRLGGSWSLADVGALPAGSPSPAGNGLYPGISVSDALTLCTSEALGERPPGAKPDRHAYFVIETESDCTVDELAGRIRAALDPNGECGEGQTGNQFSVEGLRGTTFLLKLPISEDEICARSYGSCGLFYDISYRLREGCGLRRVDPDVRHSLWIEPQQARGGAGGGTHPTDREWAFKLIDVPDAASAGHYDGAGIEIAHIDTGHTAHPELNRADTFDLARDLDVEADPDDLNAEDPMPGGNSHGTGTASIITSEHASAAPDHDGNWGTGIRGVAPASTIVSVRAIDRVVVFGSGNLIKALRHAIDEGAHVITMSLGGLFLSGLEKRVKEAVEDNRIVVAAAGNYWPWVVAPARYPACIAAGGCNVDSNRWRGSARGRKVDVSAPAEDVWRAAFDKSNGTAYVEPGSGTSFAAPAIAGVAALWLAKHGRVALIANYSACGLTLQQVFRYLLKTTATVPAGWNTNKDGAGILDARALLDAALPACEDVAAGEPLPARLMNDTAVFESLFEDAPSPLETLGIALGASSIETVMAAFGGEINRIFMEDADLYRRFHDFAAARSCAAGTGTATAPLVADIRAAVNRACSDRLAADCSLR